MTQEHWLELDRCPPKRLISLSRRKYYGGERRIRTLDVVVGSVSYRNPIAGPGSDPFCRRSTLRAARSTHVDGIFCALLALVSR
jgi:hypothetical protein